MRVRIRYFALYRDLAGKSDETVELEDGSTLNALMDRVKSTHPVLGKQTGEFLLAVNEEYADTGTLLSEGDEVAIFPNVSGG